MVTDAFGTLKDLLIGSIVALYFLSKREQLAAQATMVVRSALKPAWAEWLLNEVKFADRMFRSFFSGKLFESAIVGAICFVGCLVMGFKNPLLLAVIIGVTNIIPFFGPIIGAIPCALLLLLDNPMHALMFVIFIIVLQQIDGNILGPKILGNSTGLSALWLMFGILLFGGLWGILGMLIGVPLMAVIYDIFRQLTFRGMRERGYGDQVDAYNRKYHLAEPSKPKKQTSAQ
jgi:predicted PurR-regulated permease PerM